MYASVWKRFFAFLIDAAVFAVLFWVLAQTMNNASVSLVLLVIIWLYYALLESSPLQASLGKIIRGIKVVDRRGRRLTFWQATERIFSKLVTNVTFYFGFFIAAFDKKKRTLHDRISHSAVIAKNAEFDPEAEDDAEEAASLTFITVVSVALAVTFVMLMLLMVALPQYQRTERHVQLSRVLTALDYAARTQLKDAEQPGADPRVWLRDYKKCQKISPEKLSCDGFELLLEPGGVKASARTHTMDILYTLFYPFDGGPVECNALSKQGAEICSALNN